MQTTDQSVLRGQLIERRQQLQSAIATTNKTEPLLNLLNQVDIALEKMAKGMYGLCETCHDTIEQDRLWADPLTRNCLDHLTADEQRLLERDLDLAYQVQKNLLPKPSVELRGWQMAYYYKPAGPVSGDYCDLIVPSTNDGVFYFFVGDISGKGIAASILMAHLHAIFRSLLKPDQSIAQLVEQANRLFCEGTPLTHYATLVAGKADPLGKVEICNAGHCLPMIVQGTKIETIDSTGLPLGMFCSGEYGLHRLTLSPGESLVLYTDGITEARRSDDSFYGEERFKAFLSERAHLLPNDLVHDCLQDLEHFRSGALPTDDVTLMCLKRAA